MAGRFVFQKLASGMMSRSASRLGAQASASSRPTAQVMPRASSQDGIRTLTRFFHNAAAPAAVRPGNTVVPSISNHAGSIRGYSRVPAKNRRYKARMPSDAASKQQDGLARLEYSAMGMDGHDEFWGYLKYFVVGSAIGSVLGILAYCDDVNNSRMAPNQTLHCSGCNCRSRS